ncbi:TPA: hypothetical protein I7730_14325 [Vibrio vulnificus]|uniref:Flagellar hook-length control protein FliK n=1 Tax=Vibrio vulnificus TaxID=672 RepID=A0A8H9N1A1_VIBVL|nr:hypothetical protein [Vibrio vulnificus]HAS8540963.1 hypothetical protein [Vibrio vulnificus]
MNHLFSSPLGSNTSSKLALGDKGVVASSETSKNNSDGQQSSFTSFFQNEKESNSSKSGISVIEKQTKTPNSQLKNVNSQPEIKRLEDSNQNLEVSYRESESVKVETNMDKKVELPHRDAFTSVALRHTGVAEVSLPPVSDAGLMLFKASLMAAKSEVFLVSPAGIKAGVTQDFLNIEMGSRIHQEDLKDSVIKKITTPPMLNHSTQSLKGLVQVPVGAQSYSETGAFPFISSNLVKAIEDSKLQPKSLYVSGGGLARIERSDVALEPRVSTHNDPTLVVEAEIDPVATAIDNQRYLKMNDGQQLTQSSTVVEQLTQQQVTQSGEMKAQVSQVAQTRSLHQVDQARLLNFIESEARVFIDSKSLTREIAIKVRPHNMGEMTITLQRNDVNQSVAVNIVTANEKATNYLNLIKGEITKQINVQISVSMMPQVSQTHRLNATKPVRFENFSSSQGTENDSESEIIEKNTIKSV